MGLKNKTACCKLNKLTTVTSTSRLLCYESCLRLIDFLSYQSLLLQLLNDRTHLQYQFPRFHGRSPAQCQEYSPSVMSLHLDSPFVKIKEVVLNFFLTRHYNLHIAAINQPERKDAVTSVTKAYIFNVVQNCLFSCLRLVCASARKCYAQCYQAHPLPPPSATI